MKLVAVRFVGRFVLALSVALMGPAYGEEDAAVRAEAKRLKDQGAQAYNRGNYEESLRLLQLAYRIYPSANLRYNIGRALAKLGRNVEAVAEFERFLVEAKEIPPEAREQAVSTLVELEHTVARLVVTSNVVGAEILIDERAAGHTPASSGIVVAPGMHVVTVRHSGYKFAAKRITVAAGANQDVELHLEPSPGEAVAADAVDERQATPPSPAPPTRSLGRLPILAAVVGVAGLALAIGGIGLYASARGTFNDLQAVCPPCGAMEQGAIDDGRLREGVGYALLVAGGVLLATDVLLWVLHVRNGKNDKTPVSMRVSRWGTFRFTY